MISKIKTWLIVAGSAAIGVALLLVRFFSLREGGANERAKQQAETVKNLKTRDKVDDEVDQSSDAHVRDELGDWVRDDEGRSL